MSPLSASQILATALRHEAKRDCGLNSSEQIPPPSDSINALRSRRSSARRRVSFDENIADGGKAAATATTPSSSKEKRRVSYNDAIEASSTATMKFATSHRRRSISAAVSATRRVSFSDYDDAAPTVFDEPSAEEKERFRLAAGKLARTAGSNHLQQQQQVRRRTSYNDALSSSWEPYQGKGTSSATRRMGRRYTYNDALDAEDENDDDANNTSTTRAQRRVSFSNDIVSVREIPTISKLEKRELFYRRKDFKQFRMDKWMEQAVETAVVKNKNAARARLLPRRISNPESTEDISTVTTVTASSSSSSSSSAEPKSLDQAIRAPQSSRITNPKEETKREIASKPVSRPRRQPANQLHQAPTRDATSKGCPNVENKAEVPFLSDSFFTTTETPAVALAGNAAAASSCDGEEKKDDWTGSLRVCARARIDSRVQAQSDAAVEGTSSAQTGRRRLFKRRNSIEALAA